MEGTKSRASKILMERNNPFQQSRLDFFLVSDVLSSNLKITDILPGYRSDHSIITLELSFGENLKRNTFWKFNSSLLKDHRYVAEINDTIERIISQYAVTPYDRANLENIETEDLQFQISDQLILDVLLMEIRNKSIAYSTMKKKAEKELEVKLENEIEFLERKVCKDDRDIANLKDKNQKLEDLRQKKMEGVMIRSRARWVRDGEKITKYFCGLEKRNYVSKQMSKLVRRNGSVIDKTEDIVQETKLFYKELYDEKDCVNCRINEMINNIPTLSEAEAMGIEGEIELEEATTALKHMANNKSPGTDGFPAEFFKFFWKKRIGQLVVRSLNEGFHKKEMSNTQKEGIIICLPKGDKPREYIKNWRPISLLNVVYKIGTACIANRIKRVLPKLINEDQSGFMANRYIGNNIRLIFDIINHCNVNHVKGLLLGIDFEKAFDSLNWHFMHRVLAAFGFGESIQRWIYAFYSNIKSCVLINGQTSTWFDVRRGCRQGDPISPYLFILCAEILAIMIRENIHIKGIQIGEAEYKISQFADDTELFQNGDRETFEETIKTLVSFGEKSGLKINIEKTFAVWIGTNNRVKFMPHLKFTWNPDKFKVLGIWFTPNLDRCIQLNLEAKMQEVRALMNIWMKRVITPLGRIAVLKSLILSKLVHLFMLLPNPPDDYLVQLQKMIFGFVWMNKRDRISRATSVKNVLDGGIGIPDIKAYIKALKLTWFRKFFNCDHKWKYILLSTYPEMRNLHKYGPSIYADLNHTNYFWKHVFEAYEQFSYKVKPKTPDELLTEPLFFNKNIQIGNSCVHLKSLLRKEVYMIGHLIDDTEQFYSYEDFVLKYNVNINYITLLGLQRAVQKYINKTNLNIVAPVNMRETSKVVDLLSMNVKGTRMLYDLILEDGANPSYCTKWEHISNNNVDWKKCYIKIQKMHEVKLKWFQIRVINRILATNIVLKEIGVVNSNICSLCSKEKDTIVHCLWDCEHSKSFWHELEDFLHTYCHNTNNLQFSQNLVIFNTCANFKSDYVFDFILIFAKYYVYQCRQEKVKPSLTSFRRKLKYRYQTEVYNQKITMNLAKFLLDWTSYKPLLNE